MLGYCAIVGSRSYGLQTDRSDIDLGYVNDGFLGTSHDGKIHYIQETIDFFVNDITNISPRAAQWLFPEKSCGLLSIWLMREREALVHAQRNTLFDTYTKKAYHLSQYAKDLYLAFPKRLTYSTLYYATLARYAADMPFEIASKPDGELREKLLTMKKREMSPSDAARINSDARREALIVAGKYKSPRDEKYLQCCQEKICAIMGPCSCDLKAIESLLEEYHDTIRLT